MADTVPGLFGIKKSNRDFTQKDSWGKNQFNSAFPAALACYMDSKGLKAVYLMLDKQLKVIHREISIPELIGTKVDSENLFFLFESDFPEYRKYVVGSLPRVDLVTMDTSTNVCMERLEVKLTALPDNSTCEESEDKYSCEIVVRPHTVIYLALSIIDLYKNNREELEDITGECCKNISDWSDLEEVSGALPKMVEVLDEIVGSNINEQTPLLLQPIWKTKGKSAELCDDCLDNFVWSNLAFTRLFMDTVKEELNQGSIRMSRPARTVLWTLKMLYDYGKNGAIDHVNTIDMVTLNAQTDKAFAVNGKKTHKYLASTVLSKPRINKNEIKKIILGGGQEFLSPERRFDAIIKNTPGLFD